MKHLFIAGIFFSFIFSQSNAQQAEAVALSGQSSFETAIAKFPQPQANGCDTVNYSKGFKTPKAWKAYVWTAGSPSTGLVFGINSVGDKEKGAYLDLTSFATAGATHITATYIWFAKAYSSNPAKTVTVNVYDNSGSGGKPGTVLGSKVLTMATLMADKGYLTRVEFATPILIPASKKVYVTCDMSGLSWTGAAGTDSLCIVASDSLEEVPGIIWEKTSANAWHGLDDLTTWKLRKMGIYILPFVTSNITAPTASITVTPGNATVCKDAQITFDATGSVSTYPGSWWATPGYSSASVNGQMLIMTYSVVNTFTVGFNANGCGVVKTASVVVTVNPTPTVTATSNSPVCQGFQLQLTANGNGTAYAWLGPNAFTSTQQNPTIASASTTHTGSYAVTTSNSFGCTSQQITNVTVNPCTGVEQLNNMEDIQIVQNGSQQFFLVVDAKGEAIRISIFNISGALVNSTITTGEDREELNTRALAAGMYFVQVRSADKIFTKKIIISR